MVEEQLYACNRHFRLILQDWEGILKSKREVQCPLPSPTIFVQSLNQHHYQSLSIWCCKQRKHQDLFEVALLLTDMLINDMS